MALTMKTQNLQQQKGYVIDGESKGNYSRPNPITFFKKSLESSLCDYYDAYILVKENITVKKTIAAVAGGNPQRKQPLAAATQEVLKIVHHLKNILQKLMVLLLMKRILFILQWLCTI